MSQKIPLTVLLFAMSFALFAQGNTSNSINTSQMKSIFEIVEFQSEGATLRGRFYTPENESEKLPVVIMAHGYSATIEGMVADRYAEVLCRAGFAVLLYDHRNFGISGGEPRQQINRWTQARGYRDAMDFVATRPEIDSSRIGLWGDSMSGGEVMIVAAIDPRVKAIVAQVPACGPEPPPADPAGNLFQSIRNTFLNGDVAGTPEVTLGPRPVVSFDQETIPSMLTPLTAYRWFIEYGGRYNTKWVNRATFVDPDVPTRFNPVLCAPYIKAAVLMVVAYEDEMSGANSNVARIAYNAAPQPKQLVEIDGGHFGLLHYPSQLFDQVSSAQVSFLNQHLK